MFRKLSDESRPNVYSRSYLYTEDAGRDTSDVSSHLILMHMEFPRDTHSYPARYAAPISEAREIALRAQTAVSIAALLIIAICHKF